MQAVGGNPSAARFAGISVEGVRLRAGLASGALAGLAGVLAIAAPQGGLSSELFAGSGYAGIAVAVLASLSPFGTAAVAIVLAAIQVGADAVTRDLGVPQVYAVAVIALAMLLALGGFVAVRHSPRMVRRAMVPP
jgi:simple sugar transport system permease protein